jgi:hypothetical protein
MAYTGAQLCFTPMLNSKPFANSEAYRISAFSTTELDRPLIAQFCGEYPALYSLPRAHRMQPAGQCRYRMYGRRSRDLKGHALGLVRIGRNVCCRR